MQQELHSAYRLLNFLKLIQTLISANFSLFINPPVNQIINWIRIQEIESNSLISLN